MTKEEMIVTTLCFVPGLHNFPIGAYFDTESGRFPFITGHPDFDKYSDMSYRKQWSITNWYGKEVTEKDKENALYVDIYLVSTEPEIKFEVLETRYDCHKKSCTADRMCFNFFQLLDYLESDEIKDIRNRFWGQSHYDGLKPYVTEQVLRNNVLDIYKQDKDNIPEEFLPRFEKLSNEWDIWSISENATQEEMDNVRDTHLKEQRQLLKDYAEYVKTKTQFS